MKKGILCLLAVMLLLTGCKEKKTAQISNRDALCPYKITEQDNALCIELDSQKLPDATWQMSAVPSDVCSISKRESKTATKQIYDITAAASGLAELVLASVDAQGQKTDMFTLTVNVLVDTEGRITLIAAEHTQRELSVLESESMTYKWETTGEGKLEFQWIGDRKWELLPADDPVYRVTDILYLPSGCRIEITPVQAGTAELMLQHQETKQNIKVTLKVDDALEITVVSVEELAG